MSLRSVYKITTRTPYPMDSNYSEENAVYYFSSEKKAEAFRVSTKKKDPKTKMTSERFVLN